jgi:hypothetical protein
MKAAAGVAVALAFAASSATAQDPAPRARLQGTFAMTGRVTKVVDVFGEHVGQRVQRTWTFTPACPVHACRRVTLKRERSGQKILDTVELSRQPSGLYVGHGHFWVPLRCQGHVVAHGGRATETITVQVTQTTKVGTIVFATAIRATYDNPKRVNLTACPGGIGHDAARYHGQLTSQLP